MNYLRLNKKPSHHVLYLQKGEKINKSIEVFCQSKGIEHARYQGIGAISQVELAIYSPSKKDYSYKTFNEEYELLSLIGNFGYVKNNDENDKYFAHTHVSCSGSDFSCIGGHLVDATVIAVVEIYLIAYEIPLERSFDSEIGLQTMDLENCSMATSDHKGDQCCKNHTHECSSHSEHHCCETQHNGSCCHGHSCYTAHHHCCCCHCHSCCTAHHHCCCQSHGCCKSHHSCCNDSHNHGECCGGSSHKQDECCGNHEGHKEGCCKE